MKAVVDTNVAAYYLLMTQPFIDEARRFWDAVTDVMAPSFWEAELANAVWRTVRSGLLQANEGLRRLDMAAGLGINSVPNQILWRGAFSRSVVSGVAVYDTLFVELADRERIPLATFDKALLRAFPNIAKRPADLI